MSEPGQYENLPVDSSAYLAFHPGQMIVALRRNRLYVFAASGRGLTTSQSVSRFAAMAHGAIYRVWLSLICLIWLTGDLEGDRCCCFVSNHLFCLLVFQFIELTAICLMPGPHLSRQSSDRVKAWIYPQLPHPARLGIYESGADSQFIPRNCFSSKTSPLLSMK